MNKNADETIAISALTGFSVWLFVILPLVYLAQTTTGSTAEKPETFLSLSSTDWTGISAIANTVYCMFTLALVCFAGWQILAARKEAKINRTLAVCDRYDTDPILDAVTRRVAEARRNGSLKRNQAKYRIDVYSLFNYLESICIGVSRGLYDEAIVRDQLESIIVSYVDDLILGKHCDNWIHDTDFCEMMSMYQKWKPGATTDLRL